MEPKNLFHIDGQVVWIKLTQGKETCIDLADWPLVLRYRWWAIKGKGKVFYAAGFVGLRRVKLHRFLRPEIPLVDHADGDGLNNRTTNLRAASLFQNVRNRATPNTNQSGYKGVHWNRSAKKWHAQITVAGRMIYLGIFANLLDAAKAYNTAATELHGNFARLNPA